MSSEYINENGYRPYHGFGYFSLFSDPLDMATWSQREFISNVEVRDMTADSGKPN